MKTVYFVRHGEGENNTREKNTYLGHTAALTARGREQARVIAERAANLEFDALISSPWLRTKETAEVISDKTGHSIEYSELFMERRCPESFIGRVFDDPETQRMQHEWIESIRTGGERYLDGESFYDMKSRAARAWLYLDERTEETLLVVSHGLFLRMLFAFAVFGEGLTAALFYEIQESMRTENTGITIFQKSLEKEFGIHGDKERWRLRVWNDHAHLG